MTKPEQTAVELEREKRFRWEDGDLTPVDPAEYAMLYPLLPPQVRADLEAQGRKDGLPPGKAVAIKAVD